MAVEKHNDFVGSLADAIRLQEGICPDPNNCKNNNPGAIQADGQLASYPDYEAGYNALVNQIHTNIGRGLNLQEFFGGKEGVYPGYSPKAAGNDPVNYANVVAQRMGGIDQKTPLHQLMGDYKMPDQVAAVSLEDIEGKDYFKKFREQRESEESKKRQSAMSGMSDADIANRLKEINTQIDKQRGYVGTPPAKGSIKEWAETRDPGEEGWGKFISPSQGFGIVPGAKKLVRGWYDPDWKSRTADWLEGAGDILAPIGTAASLATGIGEGVGLAGAGAGLGEALLGGATKAAVPLIRGFGGSMVGGNVAGQVAKGFTQDPENIRLAEDIGGLAGGAGTEMYGRSPRFRAAVNRAATHPVTLGVGGAVLGSHFGPMGEILGGGGAGLLRKYGPKVLDYYMSKKGSAPSAPVTPPPSAATGGAAGAGGAAPKPAKVFVDPEFDKLAGEGHLSMADYEAHMRANNVPEPIIQAKLAKAAAKVAQNQAPPSGPTITPKPTPPPTPGPPGQPPSPAPQPQPIKVTPPPNVQVNPPPGPGTQMGLNFNQPQAGPQQLELPLGGERGQMPLPGAEAPQPPPTPPRPIAQVPPQQPRLPFPGAVQPPPVQGRLPFPQGPQMQLPFEAQAPPVQPPPTAARLMPTTQERLGPLPSQPFGAGRPLATMQQGLDLGEPPAGLRPTQGELFTRPERPGPQQSLEFETSDAIENEAMRIADAVGKTKKDIPGGKMSIWANRQGVARELGLDRTPSEAGIRRAREILADREAAKARTAGNTSEAEVTEVKKNVPDRFFRTRAYRQLTDAIMRSKGRKTIDTNTRNAAIRQIINYGFSRAEAEAWVDRVVKGS